MAGIKTVPTKIRPADFIDKVPDAQKRKDCHELVKLMSDVTGKPAVLWGSIVGFGKYHYKYADGRDGEMLMTGFSPRSQSLTLYLGPGLDNKAMLSKLGKYKTGKGCLYVHRLDDVDRGVLRSLITRSVEEMRRRYRCE